MRVVVRDRGIDRALAQDLAETLGVEIPLARILLGRGYSDVSAAREFIKASVDQLNDAFAFRDMDRAVDRLRRAIFRNEKILVYGDRDVDGICSTALVVSLLREFGADADCYIPGTEGYGVHNEILDKYVKEGVKLVVTVDCGITAIEPAQYLKSNGVDLIVTDHHQPEGTLPDCYAIVATQTPGETYPYRWLCGSGVAFKLAQALFRKEMDVPPADRVPQRTEFLKSLHGGEQEEIQRRLRDYLVLAGIATIADVVPLKGENRVIALHALKSIHETTRPGLRLMLEKLFRGRETVSSRDAAFLLIPALNAPGRMEQANLSLDLLLADEASAGDIVSQIVRLNRTRKSLTKSNHEIVRELIEEQVDIEKDRVFVVSAKDIPHGVTGIVANRILDEFNRPVIVLIDDEDGLQGSGRSPAGYNLRELVARCEDCLERFGGHNQAIGLSVKKDKLEEFRARINAALADLPVEEPEILVDTVLEPSEVTLTLADQLTGIEPYGHDNPEPLFLIENVRIFSVREVGKTGEHVRIRAGDSDKVIDLVYFRGAAKLAEFDIDEDRFDIVTRLELDEFRGVRRVNLVVEEVFRASGSDREEALVAEG